MGADFNLVPKSLEARYVDWSLPPFSAGYHSWGAFMTSGTCKERSVGPRSLLPGADANIFIVGETYSDAQAWVEGGTALRNRC